MSSISENSDDELVAMHAHASHWMVTMQQTAIVLVFAGEDDELVEYARNTLQFLEFTVELGTEMNKRGLSEMNLADGHRAVERTRSILDDMLAEPRTNAPGGAA